MLSGIISDTLLFRSPTTTGKDKEAVFTDEDLFRAGLIGEADSKERRERLGNLLAIGYGNGKTFLKKLNSFDITKEEFYDKVKEL